MSENKQEFLQMIPHLSNDKLRMLLAAMRYMREHPGASREEVTHYVAAHKEEWRSEP